VGVYARAEALKNKRAKKVKYFREKAKKTEV